MNFLKLLSAALGLTFAVLPANAQTPAAPAAPKTSPTTVGWSTKLVKLGNGEAEVQFIAEIPAGWHIYSVSMPGNNGPLPTIISIDPNSNGVEAVGKTVESQPKTMYEPAFETKVSYFEKEAVFKQRVRYKEGESKQIKATVEYMMCTEDQCLPPDELNIIIPVN